MIQPRRYTILYYYYSLFSRAARWAQERQLRAVITRRSNKSARRDVSSSARGMVVCFLVVCATAEPLAGPRRPYTRRLYAMPSGSKPHHIFFFHLECPQFLHPSSIHTYLYTWDDKNKKKQHACTACILYLTDDTAIILDTDPLPH